MSTVAALSSLRFAQFGVRAAEMLRWVTRWRRRLASFLRRPRSTQWLILQAFVLLGVGRLAIKTLSFQRIEKRMGERLAESPKEIDAAETEQVRQVARAVRVASRHTPWTSNCFPQALAAQALLRRRGIGCTVYLGAAFKADEAALSAHAWTRSGGLFPTGGDGSAQYGAVMSYA